VGKEQVKNGKCVAASTETKYTESGDIQDDGSCQKRSYDRRKFDWWGERRVVAGFGYWVQSQYI
jgi:hypothetical protein